MNSAYNDAVPLDTRLVRQLLADTFPQWAELPLRAVPSEGTDNALFRLGNNLMVRLPRRDEAMGQIEKEVAWLPKLAPYLPLLVPEPLASAKASEIFPRPWSICHWVEGHHIDENSDTPSVDLSTCARDLAGFVLKLQSIDAAGGPEPGSHNFHRGTALANLDRYARHSLDRILDIGGLIDVDLTREAWERALAAKAWDAPSVWIHGDLHGGNLLAREGKLVGIIDWGGLGVGDPAPELIPAWTLFDEDARGVYREALKVDDDTWERGKGWALFVAVTALPYYLHTNPSMVAMARRIIRNLLPEAL